MDLRGTYAGPYYIEALIGEGGMGSVWQGKHRFTGRLAAIKVLHPAFASDQQHLQRFLREAQIASAIEHDNLVRVYDVNQLPDGRLYVAMERLEGSDLASYLRSAGQQPADEILRIIGQTAAGLEMLHRAGVVHRDLKPENIFLTDGAARRVRVVDFGLAKVVQRAPTGSLIAGLTQSGITAGTPGYMAPEQALDFGTADAQADVYSLGMVAFKMATGCLPFLRDDEPASNVSGILKRTLELRNEPLAILRARASFLPPGFQEDILRAIAYDKHERFAHVRDFAFSLASRLDAGEKILRAVAPEFFDSAPPTAETVKNPAGDSIPTHLMAVAPPRTGDTLLHAAGATATAPPKKRHGRFAALGVGGVVVAGSAIAAIAVAASGDDRTSTTSVSTPAAAVAQTPPDATPAPPVRLRRMRVVTDPPGAGITIDSDAIGSAPVATAFPVGTTITVRASLDGYDAAEQAVVVTDTMSDITLTLRKASAASMSPNTVTPAKVDPAKKKAKRSDQLNDKSEFSFDPTKPIGPR